MFLEYWMIALAVIAAGLWSERRYLIGIRSGINATMDTLKERNFVKVDEKGHLVPYK